jgi:predicted nucleic acid-binding protein
VSDGFVVDSSVGVSWATLSQSSSVTDRLLDDVASGIPFVVPVLWMFEVANSLLVLMRRKRIDHREFSRARNLLSRLTPVVDDAGPRFAWTGISDLAERHALTVYDATYLELATRRGLPLASRDAALNKAAKALAVETLV